MARDNFKKAASKRNTRQAASPSKDVSKAIERGIATVEKGRREEAYKIFEETVEIYPNAPEAWVWLGGTTPNLDDAEAAFELAYSLDADNEEASLGLRWVRLRRRASLENIVGAAVPAPTTAAEQPAHTYPAETPPIAQTIQGSETYPLDYAQGMAAELEQDAPGLEEDLQTGIEQAEKPDNTRNLYFIMIAVVLALLAVGAAVWYLFLM